MAQINMQAVFTCPFEQTRTGAEMNGLLIEYTDGMDLNRTHLLTPDNQYHQQLSVEAQWMAQSHAKSLENSIPFPVYRLVVRRSFQIQRGVISVEVKMSLSVIQALPWGTGRLVGSASLVWKAVGGPGAMPLCISPTI
ncbi:hypothetical protein C8J57DRAFT_1245149 [Mycena rebaudengoi]|nr:hypothetical protein C8J57DRAFT_1245149 [Mycena rebaudengoi]